MTIIDTYKSDDRELELEKFPNNTYAINVKTRRSKYSYSYGAGVFKDGAYVKIQFELAKDRPMKKLKKELKRCSFEAQKEKRDKEELELQKRLEILNQEGK